jgi:hypothetical protein
MHMCHLARLCASSATKLSHVRVSHHDHVRSEVAAAASPAAASIGADGLTLRQRGKRPAQEQLSVCVTDELTMRQLGKRRALPARSDDDCDDLQILSVAPASTSPRSAVSAQARRREALAAVHDPVVCTGMTKRASSDKNPVMIVLGIFPNVVPAHVKALFAETAERRLSGKMAYTAASGDIEVVVQRMLAESYPCDEASAKTWNVGIADDPASPIASSAATDESCGTPGHFECGCCYTEYPYADVAPCPSGHLFCKNCVAGVVKQAVFGCASTTITCMATSGCREIFAYATLRAVLPPELHEQFINRQQDEALKAIGGNLFTCPKPDCGCVEQLRGPTKF